MQIKVETKTIQTIDGKEDIIEQSGNGTIKYYENGTILTWDVLEENLHFQMTILEDKIILKNQNQNMVFELKKTTKSILQTQYGNLNMYTTTKSINVEKHIKAISKIELIYDIQINDMKQYENKIQITIK